MMNKGPLKVTSVSRGLAVKTFLLVLFMVFGLQIFFQTGICAGSTSVFRLRDRTTIRYDQMIDDLKHTNLVFVGEVHDNKTHHRLQLDIINALDSRKIPIAVGFEMFTYESQNYLDQWVAGTLPVEDFITVYYKNWNFPWPLYEDIFLYIRGNRIPAIGLNIPPDITQKIAASGFGALNRKELEKLPSETGCVVDEKYMKFIRRAYAMHGHGDKQFLYFCEAQLMWDRAMAKNLLEFLKKHPDITVVVLAGNGHAWNKGIPEQIRTSSEKIRYRVILPHVPGHIEPREFTDEDADYILLQ